jgi:hypothetical protein
MTSIATQQTASLSIKAIQLERSRMLGYELHGKAVSSKPVHINHESIQQKYKYLIELYHYIYITMPSYLAPADLRQCGLNHIVILQIEIVRRNMVLDPVPVKHELDASRWSVLSCAESLG